MNDPRGGPHPPNCALVEVCLASHGLVYWPWLFLVALREVGAGDELLMGYGEEAWAALARDEAAHRRIAAALGPLPDAGD